MALVIEIEGVDVLAHAYELEEEEEERELFLQLRSLRVTKDGTTETCSFTLFAEGVSSLLPRPTIDQVVYIEQDTEVIFGGTIERVVERNVAGAGLLWAVSVVGYTRVMRLCTVPAMVIAAETPTLEAFEDVRAASIGPRWGIPASGVTTGGPPLPEITIAQRTLALDAFQAIANASGYLFRIAGSPGFFAHAPGGIVGPTFNEANANILSADPVFEVEQSRVERYTVVWVQIATESLTRTDDFFGDGVKTVYFLRMDVDDPPTQVEETVDSTPTLYDLDGSRWAYDADLMTIAKVSGGPLAPGDSVRVIYTALAPGFCRAVDDAAVLAGRLAERVYGHSEIDDQDAGIAQAAAYLAAGRGAPLAVRLETDAVNVYPGMQCAVSVPARLVSGNFLVRSVTLRDVGRDPAEAGCLQSEVDLVEGGETLPSWLDIWRGTVGSGGGAGGGVSVGSGGGGSPTVRRRSHDWGGSRARSPFSPGTGTAYVPVPDYRVLYGLGDGSRDVRVVCRTEHADTSVTPRIARWSGSAWVEEVEGTASTETGAAGEEQVLTFSPAASTRYRLELARNNANALVYGIGWD